MPVNRGRVFLRTIVSAYGCILFGSAAHLSIAQQSVPVLQGVRPPDANICQGPGGILECQRALYVLEIGQSKHWPKRDNYIESLSSISVKGTGVDSLEVQKSAIIEYIGSHLRSHQIWDEGPPIEVEVNRIITTLDEKTTDALASEYTESSK